MKQPVLDFLQGHAATLIARNYVARLAEKPKHPEIIGVRIAAARLGKDESLPGSHPAYTVFVDFAHSKMLP